MEIKKPKLFEKPKSLKRRIEIILFNQYDTLVNYNDTNLYENANDKAEVYRTIKACFFDVYDAYVSVYGKPSNLDIEIINKRS